ncbi:hypothetical protein OAG21_03860 [Akkermansiaceae bacterium]|nr:hypothetical protein [Akkermansiaceae bacterium]
MASDETRLLLHGEYEQTSIGGSGDSNDKCNLLVTNKRIILTNPNQWGVVECTSMTLDALSACVIKNVKYPLLLLSGIAMLFPLLIYILSPDVFLWAEKMNISYNEGLFYLIILDLVFWCAYILTMHTRITLYSNGGNQLGMKIQRQNLGAAKELVDTIEQSKLQLFSK